MDAVVLDALLDALGRLPGTLIYGYYWTKVLDVRDVRLHWAAWMALWVATSARLPFMATGGAESVLWTVLQAFVYPIAVSRGRLGYRVLVVVATMIAGSLGEMGGALFSPLVGIEDPTTFRQVLDHPAAYFACQAVVALLFALLFFLLWLIFSRLARQQVSPTYPYFGIGLSAQLALTSAMLVVTERFLWGNAVVLVAGCVFAVVNIAADALILLSVARADEAYEQQVRAEALRARLDASLAHFKDLAGEVQAVARFRHDLRDELQAVAALVRQGDYARAGALVGELEGRLGPAATEGGAR